jgi:nicotinamidase-related amidase
LDQKLAHCDGYRELPSARENVRNIQHAARVDYNHGRRPEIQEVAADAFSKRFKRGGQLSCWDDPALQSAVHALGRKNLILAGLTTDICLYWAARDAVGLGYQVMVVADACGTMSTLGDELTYASLRGVGVGVTVVNTAVTELVNNFGTPEGQKAQKIMGDEIISKLGKIRTSIVTMRYSG